MYGLFNIDEAFWLVASPSRATQPKTEEYVVSICCWLAVNPLLRAMLARLIA